MLSSPAETERHCPHPMSVAILRKCANCAAVNRVPERNLADTGRCGSCKAALPPVDEPLDVDAAQFDAVVTSSKARCWWISGLRGAARAEWLRRRFAHW